MHDHTYFMGCSSSFSINLTFNSIIRHTGKFYSKNSLPLWYQPAFNLECVSIVSFFTGQEDLVDFCDDLLKHPETTFTETMLCTS